MIVNCQWFNIDVVTDVKITLNKYAIHVSLHLKWLKTKRTYIYEITVSIVLVLHATLCIQYYCSRAYLRVRKYACAYNLTQQVYVFSYSKTRLKRPLKKKKTKTIFMINDSLMKVESLKHSAILLTCIKR